MPIAKVRGINQQYEILGDTGPWIAISPGGRTPMEEIRDMAIQLSKKVRKQIVVVI